jgi:hypothetical protein
MIKNRLVYLIYYILKTPRKQFFKYFSHVREMKTISSAKLYKDIFLSSLKYNISLMDYFQLRFYEQNERQKLKYAGTGFMYEYQLQMNPPRHRHILDDKIKFLIHFDEFSGRKWGTLEMITRDAFLAEEIISSEPYKVVLKKSRSKAGKGIMILESRNISVPKVLQLMRKKGFDLIEKFVLQHDDLMKLSPSALNTIRIITQVHDGKVTVIAARLRVSVNSNIDNLTAGNFAAPVDIEKGIVTGPGVYGDITKSDVFVHPVTGVAVKDFLVPHWKECIEMVSEAALAIPQTRSVGWDVAITNEKPILIEGNHDWGRVLWQLPVKEGLKEDLLKYI